MAANNTTPVAVSVLEANCAIIRATLNSGVLSFDALFSGIVAATLSIPVAVFNALVIYVIIRTPALHIPSNVVLCSLAMSDFLTGAIHLPLLAYISFHIKKLSCSTLLMSVAFAYSLIIVSVSGMMVVSSDRYVAIFYPYHYVRWVTNKVAAYTAITVVLLGFTIGTTSMVTSEMFLYTRALCVLIPTVLIWSVFVHIRCFIVSRKIRTCDTSISQAEQEEKSRRILTTVLLILIAMIVTYTPYFVTKMMHSVFGIYNSTVHDVGFVGRILIFANSGINPLLYCWKLTMIKREIKKLLKRALGCVCRKSVESV